MKKIKWCLYAHWKETELHELNFQPSYYLRRSIFKIFSMVLTKVIGYRADFLKKMAYKQVTSI